MKIFDVDHCEADRNSHALDNTMVQQFEVLQGLACLLRLSSSLGKLTGILWFTDWLLVKWVTKMPVIWG